MGRKRISNDDQVKMEGIDTDLSMVADEFMKAEDNVLLSKKTLNEVEERFVQTMEDHGLKTIKHEGRSFTVRETNTVRKEIVQGRA